MKNGPISTLLAATLLACGGGAPEASSDETAYREALALGETDPAAGAQACGSIGDVALRDECLLFAARALAKARGEAAAVCAEIQTVETRGACILEVVDAMALTGEEAQAACAHAGPMQERCLSHAIQRELSREARRYPLGEERAFEAFVAERVTAMGLQSTRPDYPGEQCARLIARRRGRQGPQPPFRLAECGTASASVCQEAYRVILRERLQGGSLAQELCAAPVTAEAVAAAGLPAWEEDAAALAEAAWAQTCKEARRRR